MDAASSNLTEQLFSCIAFYFPSLSLKSSSDYSQACIQIIHKRNLPEIHKKVSQLPCVALINLELKREVLALLNKMQLPCRCAKGAEAMPTIYMSNKTAEK